MTKETITIEGMSCQHCVMRVKNVISAMNGVSSADVLVGKADVEFDDKKIDLSAIQTAIEKAGYKVMR